MSRTTCLALALLTAASAAHADAPDRGLAGLDEIYPKLDALYLDLHRNPELSMKEDKTAARLASELKALGYQVTTGVGGTGVVGVLKEIGYSGAVSVEHEPAHEDPTPAVVHSARLLRGWLGNLAD